MTGLEGPALKLGGTIAMHAAKSWLQRRRKKTERESSLAELAADELKGPLEKRKLENLVETIGLQVAEELKPILAGRFSSLPENEITAAFLAVEDTLGKVDLSDEALLADDADPELLARRVREQFPARSAMLAERAANLYELTLDQACRHLVMVVRHLPSFQPSALAEILGRLTRQSDQLDQLLARIPKTSLTAPAGTDHDAEFRAEYLSLLSRKLDRLDLLGLTKDDQPTLPLTVAYLSLSVSSESSRGDDLPKAWFAKHAGHRRDGTTMRAESAIGEEHRTLVRGEAGSGKTTLLNWLAIGAAGDRFTGKLSTWNGFVPFPIRLRSFASGDLPGAEHFVAHAAPTLAGRAPANWADRVLRSGKAMILVDGVDEVEAPRRRKVKDWLHELGLTYPEARFVVTSRSAAADQRWLYQEGFGSVLLEPMSSTDIHALVDKWHEAAVSVRPEEDLDDARRRLLSQLNNRPHLRTLASSPLLCSMLCALNWAHRSELPRDRMDLYRKALSMLLHLRDTARSITVLLTEQQKLILLGHLAWRLTSSGKVELPKDEVLEHIAYRLGWIPHVDHDAEEVLNHLLERSGVLREPVSGRVDFVHRTFQEFLAASEATDARYLDTLIANAHRDTWRETVIMACGHAKHHQADKLLTEILDRADAEPQHTRRLRLLAAACLETVSNIDPAVIKRVEQNIREHLVPPRDLRETQSLASVGPRLLRYLPETTDGLSEAAAAATVRATTLTAGDDALPLLRNFAQDPRPKVQKQLSEAWQYFDPGRFADEVLADSPLQNGKFEVNAGRLLPYVDRLRHLDALSVRLPSSEKQPDLGLLSGVPALQTLEMSFGGNVVVDVTTLTDHPALTEVRLFFAKKYTGLQALKSLAALKEMAFLRSSPWRGLEALGRLEQVRTLTLDHLESIKSLEALAAMTSLTRLRMWECSPRTMAATPPMPGITQLSLYSDLKTGITAQLIAETFPGLMYLSVDSADMTDLAPLAHLPLTSLSLLSCTLSDLSPLASHPTLKTFLIYANEGDAVDVRPLADLDISLRARPEARIVGLDELGPHVKFF
ncbi:NACHT domain-containing protein [Amycolatopsis lurida]|uniref:ATP-binding protein n=1 Tax=Amycolatopsis lurida NRRL 2430 TaxID=1460371 RepID=A0A2P2FWX2_AMYLU|nr:NACHT domain-containing protein [Amycolatopsis lurida]KFU81213.1 ATP-binding protein [Amycolatopsis lurida NRRL 2430]SEE17706.1 NACHT domain-containing protein [Amycolatopsis lurida]